MDITSPAGVELMLKRTPGATMVVAGAVTTYGQVKYGDAEGFEGGELATVVRVRTVLVATGILPNLDRDATIVVGGTTYVITDHRVENDGAETRLWLGDNA